jgi:DNA-binding beta-propeller fold protein YncE
MKIRSSVFVLTSALFLGATMAVAADSPGYHVVKKLPVGGEGGWDYLMVDSAARRLYVSRATRVMVFDADSGAAVGEIPNTEGVHGIAIAADLGRGFTSNGRSATITIFDLKTLKIIDQVKSTGENPDAILYDAASRRVFAFNGRTGNATAFDAATGQVAGTIPLGGKPEFATSDGQGRVFVNLEDKNAIAVIDSKKLTVEKQWPLAPCEEPSGMAIDRAHKRLFAGCGNKVMAVVDFVSGKVIGTVPIGEGVDANAFDPGTGLAFASNGDGTMTVAQSDGHDKYTVVQTVPTQRRARTMALDEKTHTVFLPTAEFGPPPSPTAETPRPRPSMGPGTFVILVVSK